MSFKVGENIGPYQLLEKIGEGGMGTVFKAYHPSLDRYVAVKLIHPAHREDQTFVARFQREARLVAKLEHPHIVPIHDYSEYEKVAYLVMKFIEGNTLKDRLARGPLNFYETLQVVDSVGSALAYAHNQGMLHRDIKPSNVLLGKNGVMYLVDFGLARIAQSDASALSSESNLGTPHYISPEQALGKHGLDKRTDIYSFGVMLYELIVGQAPFAAKTGYAIIHDHIYTPPPSPRTLNPQLSESVEQVLLKALAKDPNDRFDTIDQMILAFKNAWLNVNNSTQDITASVALISDQGTSSSGYGAVKKAPPQKKRLEWLYILLGIALGVGLAFSLVPRLRGKMMATLSSIKIPAVFVESTPTNLTPSSATPLSAQDMNEDTISTSQPLPVDEVTNNNSTPAPQATNTSVPRPTNTPVPNPTQRPTDSLPIVLTPPVLKTVVNVVTDIPPILPSLPPLLP